MDIHAFIDSSEQQQQTQQQQQQQQQNNNNKHNNNNKACDSSTRFLVCVTVMIQNPADGSCAERAHVGSARRRRERRLRAQWRHEQQTVAMALAAATHHSAQRGEWRDLNEAPRGQRTASAETTYDALRSQTTSVAGDTEFLSLYEEELGGTRPDRLYVKASAIL